MQNAVEIGDRVTYDGYYAEVSFVGEGLSGLPAGRWVGITFDEPVGKNDGSVKGVRYWTCKKNYGSLVRPDKLRVCHAENAMRAADRGGRGPPAGHAARGHELSDQYMKNFEHAYALLASDAGASGVGLLRGGGGGGGGPARGQNKSTADGDRASGGLAVQGESRERVEEGGVPSKQHGNGMSVAGRAGDGCGDGGGGDWCDLEGLETLAELSISGSGVSSAERWAAGPKDPRGTLIDLSDRPNICMSVLGNEAVIGSSDHALYGIDIRKGVKSRTLYTKQCGHTEWVTCVTHLKDGRVLSGGMDSKLCLWNKAGNRCVDLKAHSGSISAVKADEGGVHAISAGYDGLVCVWDTAGHPSRALKSTLKGHTAPVTCLTLGAHGRLVSGARDSSAILWDLGTGGQTRSMRGHRGHVTSAAWAGPNIFLTGAQDGIVRVWDVRGSGTVATVEAHVSQGGAGAVGDIVATSGAEAGFEGILAVTSGADGRVQTLEARQGWKPLHTMMGHRDFIYSLAVSKGLCFSGAGDGSLICHSLSDGSILYGLGANKAAVRCIGLASDILIASGDDGNAILFPC